MTLILAGVILLALPLFFALLRGHPRQRHWAYAALPALAMMTNLPLVGFLYGWAGWNGISRGLAVSLVAVLALALILTRPRVPGRIPFLGLLGLYGIALLVSVFSANLWLATAFVWWQLASATLVFIAVAGESQRPEVKFSILFGFGIGLIYQAAHAIPQKLAGVVQAAGTYGHQNILGLAVELSMIPLMAAALAGDRRKIVLGGILAGLICAAGSGSRGTVGIIAAAVLLLCVLSAIRRPTPRKFGIISLGLVAMLAAAPFAISNLNARFQGRSFITAETERERYEDVARAMAQDNPLGVGANHFNFVSNLGGYAERFQIPWNMADRSVPVHNAYLLARAETGYLGEIAFILILVVPMFMALRFAFRNRKSPVGEVMIGAGVGIIANLIHNNYEFATHTLPIQLLLYINIGMIAAELRNHKLVTQHAMRARVSPPTNGSVSLPAPV